MSTAPVLDDDALHRLGEQLGSSELLCGFLCRYLALLDQRIARLEHALAGLDQDEWMDAVLSLKTSSAMAGAQALAERAAELQQESVRCPWEPAGPVAGCSPGPAAAPAEPIAARWAEHMAGLRRLATETAGQLRVFLRRMGGASSSRPVLPVRDACRSRPTTPS